MNSLSLRTERLVINYLNVFDLFTLHIFHLFWFVTCISMISHITEQFLWLGKLPFPFPWERSSGLTTPQRWQVHFLLLWAWLHWFKESARIQLRNSVCSYEASVCIYRTANSLWAAKLFACSPSFKGKMVDRDGKGSLSLKICLLLIKSKIISISNYWLNTWLCLTQ